MAQNSEKSLYKYGPRHALVMNQSFKSGMAATELEFG
jgi:hypothetical protein